MSERQYRTSERSRARAKAQSRALMRLSHEYRDRYHEIYAEEAAALGPRLPRVGKSPQPIRHGTYGGSLAHRRRGESVCPPCLRAQRDYVRRWRMGKSA